jgi:Domain of unknown function (DUF397)
MNKPTGSLPENPMWRKSTLSQAAGCVEIARVGDGVAVRDSKDPSGPVLRFSQVEWSAFLGGVRLGEFDT